MAAGFPGHFLRILFLRCRFHGGKREEFEAGKMWDKEKGGKIRSLSKPIPSLRPAITDLQRGGGENADRLNPPPSQWPHPPSPSRNHLFTFKQFTTNRSKTKMEGPPPLSFFQVSPFFPDNDPPPPVELIFHSPSPPLLACRGIPAAFSVVVHTLRAKVRVL